MKGAPWQRIKEVRQKTHFGIEFIKRILYIFNFIFMVCGFVLLIVSISCIATHRRNIPSHLMLLLVMLILIGIVSYIVGTIGFSAVYREHLLCFRFFSALLFILFFLQFFCGIAVMKFYTPIEDELSNEISFSIKTNYGRQLTTTHFIDYVQTHMKCCGAHNYTDWKNSEWEKYFNANRAKSIVPSACCLNLECYQANQADMTARIYKRGCVEAITQDIKEHLSFIGIFSVCLCSIQLILLIASTCFQKWLKQKSAYHRV